MAPDPSASAGPGTWRICRTEPGEVEDPNDLDEATREWFAASVPGTVAGALRAAGATLDDLGDLDASDWWWVGEIPAVEGGARLHLDGIATIADVWCNGRHVLRSESMFEPSAIDLQERDLARPLTIAIRCGSLDAALAARRPRPRWRTPFVKHQNLRWFRTSLLGRMPGWSAVAAPVGPWRPVEVRPAPVVRDRQVRAAVHGGHGEVSVEAVVRDDALADGDPVAVHVGDQQSSADVTRVDGGWRIRARVTVDDPELWWPHTHGTPARYPVALEVGDGIHPLGAVGFRTVTVDRSDGGFTVSVNGVPVHLRGGAWTPIDPIALHVPTDVVDAALDDVRRCGANVLRLPGGLLYESDRFFDRCDELGIVVWQDMMFANLDPPDDDVFTRRIAAEAERLLHDHGHRPSLAILCGNSEVEQQASMLGLPRERWTTPVFEKVLPDLVAASAPELVYLPSSPTGGPLPFHVDAGVSHYYGIGNFRRSLQDATRARVRFASECLGFANVPVEEAVDELLGSPAGAGHHPTWKQGVPRDGGAAFDFEDIRDHYVGSLFEVDPARVRATDPARYLDLGRVVTGIAMASTFAEWRRAGSVNAGGIVWNWRDQRPGAGWGVVDSAGRPKPCWWYLRRAFAPVALFAIDEGLNGLHLHVRNDRAELLPALVRVELFTRGEVRTESAEKAVEVDAHGVAVVVADELFDGFRDLTWAYRFGPLPHDVVACTLLDAGGARVLGRAVHLPGGYGRPVEPDLGLSAVASPSEDGRWTLAVRTTRFAQAVHLDCAGYRAGDNWFDLPPATEHTVELEPLDEAQRPPAGRVRALNLATSVTIETQT